jgi:peptidoglycan/LPS O-acetylase OafA/YrhL
MKVSVYTHPPYKKIEKTKLVGYWLFIFPIFLYNIQIQITTKELYTNILVLMIFNFATWLIIYRVITLHCAPHPVIVYSEKRGEYFPALNAIRLIGFLLVYLYHFPRPPENMLYYSDITFIQSKGWLGVDIFLVLSSFLLIKLALDEKSSTGKFGIFSYLNRRIKRTWPLYIVFICVIANIDYDNSMFSENMDRHILSFLTFSVNYSYVAHYSPPHDISHLWTISLEEQIYLIIALIMLVEKRLLGILLIIAMILSIISKQYILQESVNYPAIYMLTLPRLETGGGAALLIHLRGTVKKMSRFHETLVSGLTIICACLVYITVPSPDEINKSNAFYSYMPSGVIALIIILITKYNTFLHRLLSHWLFSYLGVRSYGMYVYHMIGIYMAAHIVFPQSQAWLFSLIIGLLITLVCSMLSYTIFERPLLRNGLIAIGWNSNKTTKQHLR